MLRKCIRDDHAVTCTRPLIQLIVSDDSCDTSPTSLPESTLISGCHALQQLEHSFAHNGNTLRRHGVCQSKIEMYKTPPSPLESHTVLLLLVQESGMQITNVYHIDSDHTIAYCIPDDRAQHEDKSATIRHVITS